MAKRGTLEHPKTKRLARALGVPAWAALGLLEAVWHWVGRYTPSGLVTPEEFEDCSDTIRFDKGGAELTRVLHACGWLDECDEKWYVHDWHDHADDSTKKVLAKRGETFANGAELRKSNLHDHSGNDSRTIREQGENDSRQPKPKPKPKPKPAEGIFRKPVLQELDQYFQEIGLQESPQRFLDYYQANGWKVGRNPMKDWRATARQWKARREAEKAAEQPKPSRYRRVEDMTPEELEAIQS